MSIGLSSALLLIDIQQGLADPGLGERSTPDAETNMARLLEAWRENGYPVIHVRHDSTEQFSRLRPGLPGNAIQAFARPRSGEQEFAKFVNSAFIGTELESYLRKSGIRSLVVIGLTTDHCISTTVRMAENLGFHVTVASDATAAFSTVGYDGKNYSADLMHRSSLVALQDEFCDVRTTDDILNSTEPTGRKSGSRR